MTNKKWKKFERLVAAINATKMKGADVKWNDYIGGRQFDVTIRFSTGDYDYLTVVECKDYSPKVPVGKVEAFVTKSIGVKANKAVIVSSSGFQSGCEAVAEQYGIELFTLTESEDVPEEILNALVTPAINVFDVNLIRYGKKSKIEFEDGPKLSYLVLNTLITQPNVGDVALNIVLSLWGNANFSLLSNKATIYKVDVPRNAIIKVPGVGQLNDVKCIEFRACVVDAKIVRTPSLDPYLIARSNRKVILEERLSGKKSEIRFSDINHGFNTILAEGKFYHSPNLGFNYYCEKIENGVVHWLLLESYQHGRKLDVRFSATIENSKGYVEIKNRTKLDKLKKYLRKFYRNERDNKQMNSDANRR